MTKCFDVLSNSRELASFHLRTDCAYSMTASCIPKQMPKKGILFSRAYLMPRFYPLHPVLQNHPAPKQHLHRKALSNRFTGQHFRIDIVQLHCTIEWNRAVMQRLIQRLIGIRQVNVLPDCHHDLLSGIGPALEHPAPWCQIGFSSPNIRDVQELGIQLLFGEYKWQLIDVRNIRAEMTCSWTNIANSAILNK